VSKEKSEASEPEIELTVRSINVIEAFDEQIHVQDTEGTGATPKRPSKRLKKRRVSKKKSEASEIEVTVRSINVIEAFDE
jgi:hypothetical protein